MMTYIYPMMPNYISSSMIPQFDKDKHYIGEIKKNGWRCLAVKESGALLLWTRHKTLIHDALPLTRDALSHLPDGTIIDGELIDKRTKDIKDVYYAFDIISLKGENLCGEPWSIRRNLLEQTLDGIDVQISEPVSTGKAFLYKLALEKGEEGIVMKHIKSKYIVSTSGCVSNPLWVKAKRPEKCFNT
jgi:DNA ligase-1